MYFILLKEAAALLSAEERAERNKKIIELYQQGKSMSQVAFELGLNRSVVNNVLRKTNTPRRSRGQPSEILKQRMQDGGMTPLTENIKKEVVRLYTQENLSFREIEKLLEISDGSIKNILRQMNIPARPPVRRVEMPNPDYDMYNEYKIPQQVFDEQNKAVEQRLQNREPMLQMAKTLSWKLI